MNKYNIVRFTKFGGARLRSLRKQYHYTLEEVSKLVGISVNTLSSYEKGYSLPNFLHLVCLCNLFYTRPNFLYYEFFNFEV